MPTYALLVSPSANRVYAQAAPALTLGELGVLDATVLEGRLGPAETTQIAGVPYVTFAGELTETDLRHVADVSSAFALFERDGDALRPVALRPLDCLDDDLLTILKYQGKTNEVFTRLLLNVTAASSASSRRMLTDRLRVLDPLCGRGTTLNQALMYGWHACGIDLDERDFEAYAAFLTRWLKDKRLKHTADSARLRRDGRTVGRRYDARFALTKEAWAAGDDIRAGVLLADTRETAALLKARSIDVLATDAPYGVQHGSRSDAGLRRSPLELLAEALPAWVEVLRPGAAVGIAVNVRTCPRDDLLALLAQVGLDPLDGPAYRGFEHRVDQAIVRDIVVGRKRSPTRETS
jgi:SAM-dependent methyltransferase